MIEVRNLTKSYGHRLAIDHLNFTVKKGEVVGFLGPNGAGKTTTMKIITGFMAPSDGFVKVAGHDVFEDPIEVKRKIGYLPETPPVYGDMYVEDYLGFVARLRGVRRPQVKSKVERALELVRLTDVRHRLIQNLSKGYKQRVGIAQAIVSEPEILILDEPTVGLDPRQVAEVRSLIASLRGKHTIILSTHILPEVQASCERIIIINNGKIIAEDSLEGLSRSMSGSRRVQIRIRRWNDNLMTQLNGLRGVQAVRKLGSTALEIDADQSEETLEELSKQVVSSGAGLLEMKFDTMNLEDIFIQLTSSNSKQQGLVV